MGSVNLAEMMPYFQTLIWYHQYNGRERLRHRGVLNVHVISDSQTTVTHGSLAAKPGRELPKVQRPLWAGMRELGHMGYSLHWHWAVRSSNSLNLLADLIAALARREILLMGKEFGTLRFDGSDPKGDMLAARAAEALSKVQFVDPLDGKQIDVNDLNPTGP
jgi:hypothetical protein